MPNIGLDTQFIVAPSLPSPEPAIPAKAAAEHLQQRPGEDRLHASEKSSDRFYDGGLLHEAVHGAQAATASVAALGAGTAGRLGPALGQLGSKAASVVGSAARTAAPLAGEALGAAGLLVTMQSPAGETPAELARTRAVDAQRSAAAHAHPERPAQETGLESRRVYPAVNSHDLAAGVKALGDTGRCFPDSKSFHGTSRQAFDQLSKVMQPPPGWETHHLVEQARTPDFGTQAVQHTTNAINLPKSVHAEVTRVYNSRPDPDTPAHDYKVQHPKAKITTVRDYVKTLPYEAQRQFGIDTTRRVLRNPALPVSKQDRATVEHDLLKLENPALCPPDLFGRR